MSTKRKASDEIKEDAPSTKKAKHADPFEELGEIAKIIEASDAKLAARLLAATKAARKCLSKCDHCGERIYGSPEAAVDRNSHEAQLLCEECVGYCHVCHKAVNKHTDFEEDGEDEGKPYDNCL